MLHNILLELTLLFYVIIVVESTLLKLKQGSQCNTRSNPEDSKMDATDSAGEATTADADCSSNDSTCGESSISFQSTYSSKESRNMSILYFFSKCKSPRSSKDKEAMAVESGYSSSSSSVSTTSSS